MEAVVRHDIKNRLHSYATTDRPGSFEIHVRDYSKRLLDEKKVDREELVEEYDAFREVLAAHKREDLEDELLEVISILDGWCGPSAKL